MAVTISTLKKMKEEKQKISMLTAYNYPMAKIIDEAGVETILVGDSLGMVVLGYDSTLPVTMEDMIHHTKAVKRGTKNALIVADMPFLSYQVNKDDALRNAGRLIQEAGAGSVKLEGGRELAETVKHITNAGIPVMGHLGLTPQMIQQFGGFKAQGKTAEAAKIILEDAKILEESGAFGVVLEAVPVSLAKLITESISIPTIGIGAGPYCDGQVLVNQDMLGIFDRFTPSFVKKYENLNTAIKTAVASYRDEVRSGAFPAPEHCFDLTAEEAKKL